MLPLLAAAHSVSARLPGRYQLKVRILQRPRGSYLWRYYRSWRGHEVGEYAKLPELISELAPGRSFVDVGCMWGVDGEYAFLAEEAGATRVVGVDVFGPTPEFVAKRQARGSGVEFVLGDVSDPSTLERVGEVDVVFCAGVLYHHPSPFDLLVALRRMCRGTLLLRTSTIPEAEGVANAAVYFPMLSEQDRRMWDLRRLGLLRQVGITDAFEPDQGYGNWFWGLSPSCLVSLLQTAGFQVERQLGEPFVQTLVCTPVDPPFHHRLPDPGGARELGDDVSRTGVARPA